MQTRLKGWLTCDGEFFIGPRYIRLLEAVGAAGTIRGACEQCDMSYRTCINRIRHMERILGAPILTISRGGSEHGSAKLTRGTRAGAVTKSASAVGQYASTDDRQREPRPFSARAIRQSH